MTNATTIEPVLQCLPIAMGLSWIGVAAAFAVLRRGTEPQLPGNRRRPIALGIVRTETTSCRGAGGARVHWRRKRFAPAAETLS
jgi:hypothetical protein